MTSLLYAVPAMGIVGLLYTILKYAWVSKQDAGNERMKEISTYIAEGAMAFLRVESKTNQTNGGINPGKTRRITEPASTTAMEVV